MRRKPLPPVQKTREVTRKRTKRKSVLESVLESDFVLYSFVSLVGAFTYANSVDGEFVHDDIPAIVSNNDVNGGNSVFRVFLNDFWGTPMSDVNSHKSYRPLTTLTFRLNYILSGVSPRWWHITNILLHATCTSLVLRAGVILARLERPFAVLAALLFAVHPVHAEASRTVTLKTLLAVTHHPLRKRRRQDQSQYKLMYIATLPLRRRKFLPQNKLEQLQ